MSSRYTDLVISGVGLPDYAVRGVRQTITPIDQATRLERTVNGALVNLGESAFQKYKTTISGSDQEAPALGDVWPGRVVTVTSIVSLASTGRVSFTGLVRSFAVSVDEWSATIDWTLEIEQI